MGYKEFNKINLFHIFILYYICSIKSKQLNIMDIIVNDTKIKTQRVIITIDGFDYRISTDNQGGLVINKFPESIIILPNVSNQITIK